jgi:hypothetical protein
MSPGQSDKELRKVVDDLVEEGRVVKLISDTGEEVFILREIFDLWTTIE